MNNDIEEDFIKDLKQIVDEEVCDKIDMICEKISGSIYQRARIRILELLATLEYETTDENDLSVH